MILETFPSGPIETNAYLVGCFRTKQACIIDAPLHCTREIFQCAEEKDLNVISLLLTHSHWDHIADAASLKKTFPKAKLFVHALDASNVRQPGSDKLPLFFPIDPVEPDELLTDLQILQVGDLSLQVLWTPGHTPGGVCFYLSQQEVLFSGDTLFQGGMGRIDLPTADPVSMWKSLDKLSKLPPATQVFPGHGPFTRIEKESWIQEAKRRFH